MKTIILAAGRGKRLKHLTLRRPKCLLELDKKSPLEMIIENCLKCNLYDFLIIAGHGILFIKRKLKEIRKTYPAPKYKIVYNPYYKEKNNCYSLYLALLKSGDKEDILIINSDVIFDEKILLNLLKTKQTSLIIDDAKKLTREGMKVFLEKGKITDINKGLNIRKSYGEYIGLAKISRKDIPLLKNSLKKIIKKDPGLYYEDAFQLMFKKVEFLPCSTHRLKWAEIDTKKDLECAKKLAKEI